MDTYRTISTAGEAIYTEKRSKFIAYAEHVADEEAVKNGWQNCANNIMTTRHVCYAYALGNDASVTRANDDGGAFWHCWASYTRTNTFC